MKAKLTFIFMIMSLISSLGFAQNILKISNDSLAVISAALDYADGFYSGDAERMERALHPDLNKVCPVTMTQTGKSYLIYSTFSGLIELTRAKAGALPEAKRKIRVDVLKMNDNVACARIMSANFNDYLQLVKIDEQWKIINALWTWGEDSPNRKPLADYKGANERKEIEQTVNDLFEGIYSSNAMVVESKIHPEFQRATLVQMPSTAGYMIQRDAAGALIEATRAGLGALDREKWNISVQMLDCMDGLAVVELKVPTGWSYCQLAKIEGQWKIINILRKPAR